MEMTVKFAGGSRVQASFESFTVETDQPQSYGGDGSAPTPFELFMASLATCAGYYVLGFCKTRGISAEGIHLIQKSEQQEKTRMVEKVTLEIHLPSDFPEQYKAAVIKAAESCLVKKHLDHPPSFEIVTV